MECWIGRCLAPDWPVARMSRVGPTRRKNVSEFFDNYLDDTHRAVRANALRFAEKEILPHAFTWEEAGVFDRALYVKAAQAGVLGLCFPEEVGGEGGGALHLLMNIEGLMTGGSTGVTVGLGSLGIALPPIVHSGNQDLIDRFVRPTLRGETIAALAVTEPNTGSDVAGVRTRAVRNGDHYIVNGAKMFITSGTRADILVTLCRTSDDPHAGLTFLVIEKTMPGVSVAAPLRKTGWWASDTAELHFENVRVPVENTVGGEGFGFYSVMQNFQMERMALAGYGYVTAKLAYEAALQYTKEREAFGRSIRHFQVIRHKLVEMATKVLTAQTLAYQVAETIDRGAMPITEVSMAKNVCADIAMQVTYDAVQIFGGMGYMRENVVERLSRDARLLPIGGGTTEIMKEIISRRLDI